MTTERALIDLAHEAPVPHAFREGLLALLCSVLEAEIGLFVTVEAGREVRAARGLSEAHQASLDKVWRQAGREVRPVKEHALRHGVATDRQVLGTELERTKLFRQVMAPIGGTETLFLVPRLGARPLGMVVLGRRGGRFSEATLSHARSLVAIVSVACRAVSVPPDSPPELTDAERDLLDYLELGWGTRHIAEARGTSFFTVRNQLSALYRKLDVTNRAEAIGRRRGCH